MVLRGEDERLSVRAEVTRGVGDVEVYWTLDGALNYQGLASDDVELLVGKHDDARLYAVDRAGQPAVVNLPRVVKLPPLELPEMVYGITAHLQRGVAQGWGIDDWYTWSMAAEAMDMIRDAGLQFVRFDLAWDSAQPDPGDLDDGVLVSYQRLFAMLDERGLVGMPIIYNGFTCLGQRMRTSQSYRPRLAARVLVNSCLRYVPGTGVGQARRFTVSRNPLLAGGQRAQPGLLLVGPRSKTLR